MLVAHDSKPQSFELPPLDRLRHDQALVRMGEVDIQHWGAPSISPFRIRRDPVFWNASIFGFIGFESGERDRRRGP
jgi:hypothetical protein